MKIGFAMSDLPLSKWIVKFSTLWIGSGSKSRTSHAFMRFGGTDTNWMVEASIMGFSPNWWPRFTKERRIVKEFEIINVDENMLDQIIESFIEKNLYAPYEYLGLVGFALSVLWYKITKKRIKNLLGSSKYFGCSEVVYRILKEYETKSGTKLIGDYDPELVFPEELLIECEKTPEFFKEIEL